MDDNIMNKKLKYKFDDKEEEDIKWIVFVSTSNKFVTNNNIDVYVFSIQI